MAHHDIFDFFVLHNSYLLTYLHMYTVMHLYLCPWLLLVCESADVKGNDGITSGTWTICWSSSEFTQPLLLSSQPNTI